MGLFDLIEQNNAVRAPPYRLGKLPPLLVADIAGRRADQPRHRMLLLIFAHVYPHDGLIVVEQELGKGLRRLRFADPGGTEENERADGAVRFRQPRPCSPHRVGNEAEGGVLADDAAFQAIFHFQQLFCLAFQHPADGNAGPLGDNLGNHVAVYLLRQHLPFLLGLRQLQVFLFHFPLESRDIPIADFGSTPQVAFPLHLLRFFFFLFQTLLQIPQLPDDLFFLLPVPFKRRRFRLERLQLVRQLAQPFPRMEILFLLPQEGLFLDLQLNDLPVHLVDLYRHRIDLDPKA